MFRILRVSGPSRSISSSRFPATVILGIAAVLLAGCAATGTQTLSSAPANHSSHDACAQCHPIDVGTHAAFVVGHLRVGASGQAPPPSVAVIYRNVDIAHRGDVLVSGVLTASNPNRARSELSLASSRYRGRHQTFATAHSFEQAVGADIPGHRSVTIPYAFVYSDVPSGRDRFDVQVSVLDAGLTIGPVSLVVQPLN